MTIEDVIKDKIKNNSRKEMVYIHPVISNEEISKYISALSNYNGGIIVFGVKDDGMNLWIKKSVFNINKREREIRKMVDINAIFEFGKIFEKGCKLEYIYVKKNNEQVCFNGIAYILDEKNNKPQPIKKKTIFLSYCSVDSDIANIVEEKLACLNKSIKISRDEHDVGYKESFSDFTQAIGAHDYFISIVSDNYLKSRNCMSEILELMRDRSFMNRLLYIVILKEDIVLYKNLNGIKPIADIYTIEGQTKYMLWWKNKENKLREEIKILNNPLLSNNQSEELKLITEIQIKIQDFMKELYDKRAVPLVKMLESNFKDIISCINSK